MSSRNNWLEEMQSVFLYKVMAGVEKEAVNRSLFTALARAAEDQAKIWEQRLREQGDTAPISYRPTLRAKTVAQLIRWWGPQRVSPILAAMKVRGLSVYGGRLVPAGHHPMPTNVSQVADRHGAVERGGNLRAAVFGINDGLVSNASLIMGVAGASNDPHMIYVSGAAGLLAGAFSMAAGEYISMRSQRELYEYQIGLEREELEAYPAEEAEELALIYQARGVPMHQARQVARDIMQDPEHALATLAREELGLNPGDLGSPWGAALASFLAFAIGAVVPLVPFLIGYGSILHAAMATGIALFVVGCILSLFTGRSALLSGVRMVAIGGLAGSVTYALGKVLGVGLS